MTTDYDAAKEKIIRQIESLGEARKDSYDQGAVAGLDSAAAMIRELEVPAYARDDVTELNHAAAEYARDIQRRDDLADAKAELAHYIQDEYVPALEDALQSGPAAADVPGRKDVDGEPGPEYVGEPGDRDREYDIPGEITHTFPDELYDALRSIGGPSKEEKKRRERKQENPPKLEIKYNKDYLENLGEDEELPEDAKLAYDVRATGDGKDDITKFAVRVGQLRYERGFSFELEEEGLYEDVVEADDLNVEQYISHSLFTGFADYPEAEGAGVEEGNRYGIEIVGLDEEENTVAGSRERTGYIGDRRARRPTDGPSLAHNLEIAHGWDGPLDLRNEKTDFADSIFNVIKAWTGQDVAVEDVFGPAEDHPDYVDHLLKLSGDDEAFAELADSDYKLAFYVAPQEYAETFNGEGLEAFAGDDPEPTVDLDRMERLYLDFDAGGLVYDGEHIEPTRSRGFLQTLLGDEEDEHLYKNPVEESAFHDLFDEPLGQYYVSAAIVEQGEENWMSDTVVQDRGRRPLITDFTSYDIEPWEPDIDKDTLNEAATKAKHTLFGKPNPDVSVGQAFYSGLPGVGTWRSLKGLVQQKGAIRGGAEWVGDEWLGKKLGWHGHENL